MSALLRSARRAAVAAATFALVANPSLAAAQTIGVNAAIRNSVQIRRAGTTQPAPAVLRQRVAINDEVRTGAASQLQILLLDRSSFTVGANARLTIDRFVYDPARNSRSVGASATRGAFRFISGRGLRPGSSSITVRTPVSSIGVRGTIFEGLVGGDAVRIAAAEPAVGGAVGGDSEGATLIVLRGPGAAAQAVASPGSIDVRIGDRTVRLDRPGQALYMPGAGLPPIGPFMISDAGLISMQMLLRTIPTSAGAIASSAAAGSVEPGPAGSTPDQGGAPGSSTGGGPGGAQRGGAPGGSAPADGGGNSWLFAGVPLVAILIVLLAEGGGGPISP